MHLTQEGEMIKYYADRPDALQREINIAKNAADMMQKTYDECKEKDTPQSHLDVIADALDDSIARLDNLLELQKKTEYFKEEDYLVDDEEYYDDEYIDFDDCDEETEIFNTNWDSVKNKILKKYGIDKVLRVPVLDLSFAVILPKILDTLPNEIISFSYVPPKYKVKNSGKRIMTDLGYIELLVRESGKSNQVKALLENIGNHIYLKNVIAAKDRRESIRVIKLDAQGNYSNTIVFRDLCIKWFKESDLTYRSSDEPHTITIGIAFKEMEVVDDDDDIVLYGTTCKKEESNRCKEKKDSESTSNKTEESK